MDATEYDRVADLLMQIRKKISKIHYTNKKGQWTIEQVMANIDDLLQDINDLGEVDAKGWL